MLSLTAYERARAICFTGPGVLQLSDDQLRQLVAEIERRFRDEALTSAAQAATIILNGVKADRWRILVGRTLTRSTKWCASPRKAHDIAFFEEFARAAGWTERLSLENPGTAPAELSTGLSAVSTKLPELVRAKGVTFGNCEPTVIGVGI